MAQLGTHGEGPPPHPPTFAQQLLGKVSPRGLTQEQGPTATQGGKQGSRAGGEERPQRGAGLAKTLEEEGGPNSLALRLSSRQKLGVSRASRRVRRHPHRGGQTRDGLQRARPGTARAHQAALPCTARSPLAFKPGGPGSSESTQDGLPRASPGLGLPIARSLSLTRLGSAHRGSPACSWSWRSWALRSAGKDRQTREEAPSPGCGPPTGRVDPGAWELLCGRSRPF